jgi:hypothetical protein
MLCDIIRHLLKIWINLFFIILTVSEYELQPVGERDEQDSCCIQFVVLLLLSLNVLVFFTIIFKHPTQKPEKVTKK